MNRRYLVSIIPFLLTVPVLIGCQEAGSAQSHTKDSPAAVATNTAAKPKQPDVIFIPTPPEVVDKMLELAEIKPGDIVYDLGCGDGRIVVAAAKMYGVRAIGVDIDPRRVKEALENVRTNKLDHLVTIKQADIFELDFSDATVVMLYLLPDLNVRLMPKLAQLKPGARIVSNDFDMQGAKPKEVVNIRAKYDDSRAREHTIYKWTVPWERE